MRPLSGAALLVSVAALALALSLPAHAQIPGWSDKAFGEDTQGSAAVDANGVWTVKG
jgi:hypothetical protein